MTVVVLPERFCARFRGAVVAYILIEMQIAPFSCSVKKSEKLELQVLNVQVLSA